MTDFKPFIDHMRKSCTEYTAQSKKHLFAVRYSPMWVGSERRSRAPSSPTVRRCVEKLQGTDHRDEKQADRTEA